MAYRLTRFDLTLRHALIPHPAPFAKLVCGIADEWQRFEEIADNPSSVLRPMLHPDGRVFVMSGYGEVLIDARRRELVETFGSQFVVHADIKNFYPSIYSHAIAWALAPSKTDAKRNASDQAVWYNKLDALFRKCRRNETNGVPIGPGTSNIAAEIILGRVDAAMRSLGYVGFVRYIDDYTFYAKTQDQARQFVRDLQDELLRFELHLNGSKTSVSPLPAATRVEWISLLLLNKPSSYAGVDGVRAFLDFAIELASRHPSGSVLRYAIHLLVSSEELQSCMAEMVKPILNLAFHKPILMPSVAEIFDNDELNCVEFAADLNLLTCEFVRNRQTDAACWTLDILISNGLEVTIETIEAVILAADCVPMTLLYSSGKLARAQVSELVGSIFKTGERFDQDQWWLFLYEVFLDDPSLLPDVDESFGILRSCNVRFMDRKRLRN